MSVKEGHEKSNQEKSIKRETHETRTKLDVKPVKGTPVTASVYVPPEFRVALEVRTLTDLLHLREP